MVKARAVFVYGTKPHFAESNVIQTDISVKNTNDIVDSICSQLGYNMLQFADIAIVTMIDTGLTHVIKNRYGDVGIVIREQSDAERHADLMKARREAHERYLDELANADDISNKPRC